MNGCPHGWVAAPPATPSRLLPPRSRRPQMNPFESFPTPPHLPTNLLLLSPRSIYLPRTPFSNIHSETLNTVHHARRTYSTAAAPENLNPIHKAAGSARQMVKRDAEAELNLPPGFRFHPTDEELVADYLCARAAGRAPPVPIIAEVDLYRHDPWELPDRALFGAREWYFFTPRDRKYPNGSRPSRAAGGGYWKATGADRPVARAGRTVGIKKALVFYHGRPGAGVKTDWIMHEYRLAGADGRAARKKMDGASLRLDDWVLCRLYNKKNQWEKMQRQRQLQEEAAAVNAAASRSVSWAETRTPESDVDNDAFPELDSPPAAFQGIMGPTNAAILPKEEAQQELDNDEWLTGISLDDLQGPGSLLLPWDDSYAASFLSPVATMKMEQDVSPFFF